jgi:ribonuclease Z
MKLIVLGSSAAVPDRSHLNSHLAIIDRDRTILIDCSGTQLLRLQEAGIAVESVTDIILTHFHPDHVGGMPLLLMNMWLLGRRELLSIHALDHCIDRLVKMMELYSWQFLPGLFPVSLGRVQEREQEEVLIRDGLRITSSPVRHVMPNLGLRIEHLQHGQVITYSSDTEPCDAVVRLAQGAHTLIHEATGEMVGHSSARQAGEIARRAGVSELVLIHYPVHEGDTPALLQEAGEAFNGPVRLAQDFMEIEF